MKYDITLDNNRLLVFIESRKRRTFVGELIYDQERDIYEFIYDKKYAHSKKAIAISPELSLFKTHHLAEKGKLFPVFLDRIPLKSNPAYKDYCESQNIDPNEDNPIVLLRSIGHRGPSSFIFEPAYKNEFSASDILRFRKQCDITQHDLAKAFDLSVLTLKKIESGKSYDKNTLKLLQIYFKFPEVAIWQLERSHNLINIDAYQRLRNYFSMNLYDQDKTV